MFNVEHFRCETRDFLIGNYLQETQTNNYNLVIVKDESWNLELQSSLIESILLRIHIGNFWFYRKQDHLICIDGNKRLISITNFLRNEFKLCDLKIYTELNGISFNDLRPMYKRRIIETYLSVNYINLGTSLNYKLELINKLRCQ